MADEPLLKICGRYAVCDVIGSGGMATVHIGRLLGPVGFSRTVAIKRMHPHLSSDPTFVTMFLDEARVAARVQHANVVSTLDVVTEAGELFLVMEYVEGESFARVLRTVGRKGVRLPHPILGAIVSQALHGLHAVHEARDEAGRSLGLVHRDISPDNILIGSDGLARILDFGIAKATEHGRRTQAGKIKGKVAYMAPEQMRGKDLDRRVDLYAASAVLWEALTGGRLVQGTSDVEMIHHALSTPPPPPSSVVPSLPREIDELVMKGLSHAPEERFATAREMGMAVEKVFGLASPATVAQLIEGMLGASLAKRAALVAAAMRRTGDLDERNITQAPSTPEPRLLSLDSQNLFSDVSESPRGLIGPASPQPSAVAPAASPAAKAPPGPFAPVMGAEAPNASPQLVTRGYGSDGAMPFAELLASGGTDPAAKGTPGVALDALPALGAPIRAGTELMGARAAPAPTLQSPSHAVGASGSAAATAPKNHATVLMPDLLDPAPKLTQPSAGVAARAQAPTVQAPESASAPSASEATRGRLPSLDLGLAPATAQAPAEKPAPVAPPQKPASSGGAGGGSMDVDWGATRKAPAPAPAPVRQQAPPVLRHGQLHAATSDPPKSWLPLVVGLALAAGIAAVTLGYLFADRKPPAAPSATRPPESATATTACELLRRRVYSGGAATGLSREGWQAELWLRGQGGAAIDPGKVDVAAMRGSDAASGSETTKLTAPGQKGDEGLLIRLWGPAAQAAFDPQGTDGLIKQADLAFEQTNAEAGALYLKCSHLPYHDVGIWFRGNDLTTTTASVLFTMGVYAEKPVIRDGALGPPGTSTFERVLKKVKEGRMDDIGLEVQRYGGSLQPPASKRGMRILFPGERMPDAVRLSRVLADRAGIEDL